MGAGISFVLSLGVFYVLVKWLIVQGEKQTADQFIRGSTIIGDDVNCGVNTHSHNVDDHDHTIAVKNADGRVGRGAGECG